MTSHQPIILGITGGIACGKSEAGRILADEGVAVLDTDLLAHEVMAGGTPVFERVVEQFGDTIIGPDGEIDRTKLGAVVFADPAARETLNRLVHPAVIDAANAWMDEQREAGRDAAVLVPLLFEAGWTDGWDAVVCVAADDATVFQRLEKRGLSLEEAGKRITAQMLLNEKENKSDFILKNNETLDTLRIETLKVLEAVRSRGNDHE